MMCADNSKMVATAHIPHAWEEMAMLEMTESLPH